MTHFLAVEEDITERKRSEEKINQQNDRLNAIIKAMPDLIFVIDEHGTYTEFYCSTPESLFLPEDQIVGANLNNLFSQDKAKLHLQNIQSCIAGKQLITYEYNEITADVESYFEARLAPMGSNKVLTFVRDITERKKAEQEKIGRAHV